MQRTQGTLDFHISAVVTSLTGDSKPFSAHDITARLRKKTNDGEIEIIGRPYVKIGGVDTQIINHAEVRDAVHALFETGTFPALSRENNGTYWTYSPVTPTSAAPLPPGSVVPGSHPFFGTPQLSPPPANAPFSAPTPFPAQSQTGTGGTSSVSGVVQVPVLPPVIPGSGTISNAVITPSAPPVDPLARFLLDVEPPVIRLRHVATGKFLKLGNKTRWNRRCDLSQTVRYQRQIKSYVDSGVVEIVKV